MSNLLNDEIQLERLKLKLAINKYLRKWGKEYANTLGHKTRCDNLELFTAVVEEMYAAGMLTKELGHNSALILVYREMTPEEASHA